MLCSDMLSYGVFFFCIYIWSIVPPMLLNSVILPSPVLVCAFRVFMCVSKSVVLYCMIISPFVFYSIALYGIRPTLLYCMMFCLFRLRCLFASSHEIQANQFTSRVMHVPCILSRFWNKWNKHQQPPAGVKGQNENTLSEAKETYTWPHAALISLPLRTRMTYLSKRKALVHGAMPSVDTPATDAREPSPGWTPVSVQ